MSGRVRIPLTGLTTPVGWLSLPQTDRPESVRNDCVIEVFGGVLVLSRCFLNFSVGVGAFVIGLSQISSFISYIHIPFFYVTEFFGFTILYQWYSVSGTELRTDERTNRQTNRQTDGRSDYKMPLAYLSCHSNLICSAEIQSLMQKC